MDWEIEYTDEVIKDFDKIDHQAVSQIIDYMSAAAKHPNPKYLAKPYKSVEGTWIFRSGNYRIQASILESEKVIKIYTVGHRKDIYKKSNNRLNSIYR